MEDYENLTKTNKRKRNLFWTLVAKYASSQMTDAPKYTLYFNTFTPKCDQHLISPHEITPKSNIKVTRIKEMITNSRSSWLWDTFSLLAPWKMYREQYGEYARMELFVLILGSKGTMRKLFLPVGCHRIKLILTG